MAIVNDTPAFGAFMQEHLQYLSNLFQVFSQICSLWFGIQARRWVHNWVCNFALNLVVVRTVKASP